ncbi:MAG: NAD(P)-binding domain-containing protein [archaeon]
MYDVIIVGSGPAGIACALRCKELNVEPLVLEQGVLANTLADYHLGKKMFGVVGFFQADPHELIDFYRKDFKMAKVDVREHHKVTSIKKKAGFFEVAANDEVFKAKAVVVAVGVQGIPQTIGVPGEDKKHVYYKLEDPAKYAGRNVVVVGGGDVAIEAAIALCEAGANVVLSYRRPLFFRVKELNLKMLGESKVDVRFSTNVTLIKNKSVMLRHPTDSLEEVKADDVFIFVGNLRNVEFFREIGLDFDEKGNIVYDDETFETTVKGLFIAGDITKDKFKLIVPAMYHGMKAASYVLSYKVRNK